MLVACLVLAVPSAARAQAVVSPLAVARVQCAAACVAPGAVRPGSLLRLYGKALTTADEVVFLGAPGDLDDVSAVPMTRRKTSVDVRVPLAAAPGPVAIADRAGARGTPSVAPVAVVPAPPASGPSIELAVRSAHFYYDAVQPATLNYVLHAPAPADVAVDLVRLEDGVVIMHWDVPQVAPEALQTVSWDGLVAGKVQRTGRYTFRVAAAGIAVASQVPAKGPDPAAFAFGRDRFPILGAFTFGTGVAAFGGGRGHQGEDVFADCGTPLVAAHGGVVEYAGYHARAGYYIAVDNEGTGTDYTYMHMREAALVATGDRVRTGQWIGFVGDTGDASACHLHFEIWNAPGWYTGGRPIDPLPSLRAWASGGVAPQAASRAT